MGLNQDGYISCEDYECIVKRMAEYGKLTKERAQFVHEMMLSVASRAGLKPGMKLPLEEAVKKASESSLAAPAETQRKRIRDTHNPLFDAIDTNQDGNISLSEYSVYFKVVAPMVTENDIKKSFNIIDKTKNGLISREEFLEAAYDFFYGLEETELSKSFFGPLVD